MYVACDIYEGDEWCFRWFIDEFVIVYLDDILIFSCTWEEHVKHVKQFLGVLVRDKLYLNMSRCEFGKIYLLHLGYIVECGELIIDPSKVEVVVNWPKPNNVTEVRSFLGASKY